MSRHMPYHYCERQRREHQKEQNPRTRRPQSDSQDSGTALSKASDYEKRDRPCSDNNHAPEVEEIGTIVDTE